MSEKYYCPDCKGPLEELTGCGTQGFFCDSCKKLISRKKILSEQDLQKSPESSEIKSSGNV